MNYNDSKSANQASEKLNMTEFRGNKIKVEISKRSRPRPKTPGKYLGYA